MRPKRHYSKLSTPRGGTFSAAWRDSTLPAFGSGHCPPAGTASGWCSTWPSTSSASGSARPWRASTSAWVVGPDIPPEQILALYRDEIDRANAIIRATPLNAAPEQWAEHFGSWRLPDLRAILLHVIVETACHAGHLDAAREVIDGTTWLILE
jgi:hypothetical protein